MSGYQLPDEAVQAMLEDIERTGRVHAAAKGKTSALTELRKIHKAQLMKVLEANGVKSLAAQTREAYAHPTHQVVVDRLVAAIEEEMNAAVAHSIAEKTWESWRTRSADLRAASRG